MKPKLQAEQPENTVSKYPAAWHAVVERAFVVSITFAMTVGTKKAVTCKK